MPDAVPSSDPVLVWGGGAIGGTLAACWARAGVPVLMVDAEPRHVAVCREAGLRIEGPVEQFTQVIPAVTPDALQGIYRRCVLAVKALATEASIRAIRPHLADDGVVVSAQNGLNELVIAEHVGAQRTLGCFVNFGADWLEPGRILFGSRGAVVVGEIEGPVRDRTVAMHALMQVFEPDAVLTDNIWGYLWGKLGYLSLVYASALDDASMLDCFSAPENFGVLRGLGREVMAVAAARGIRPVGFNGFDPVAFAAGADEPAARRSIAALCEFRRRSAKTHSGIWRDLAIRKRRTEVDSQIGLVCRLGRELGVATPGLDRLHALIHDIEAGRRPQSPDTFRQLEAACRSATTSTAASRS